MSLFDIVGYMKGHVGGGPRFGVQAPDTVVKTKAYMSQYHIAHRLFAGMSVMLCRQNKLLNFGRLQRFSPLLSVA